MFLKIAIFIFCSVLFVFGNTLEVKDAGITVKLDEQNEKYFDIGEYELGNTKLIELLSGKGKGIVNKTQILTFKKIISLPQKYEYTMADFIASLFNKNIKKYSVKTIETTRDGQSTKGTFNTKINNEIVEINKNDEFFIFASEEFGPTPLSLYIKDKKGKVLKEYTKAEDNEAIFTVFPIKVEELENDYILEVKTLHPRFKDNSLQYKATVRLK